MFDPLADIDGAFRDLPYLDPDFPPGGCPVIVESGGTEVFGDLSLAAGCGAKGTVIISPPMGGGDSLESLIVPLNYAGIHVLTYHPRGTSREGESYSMSKAVDDVHALVDWIVANAGEGKTGMGGTILRLDKERVALFGLGWGGGNVSFAACAESKVANYAIAAAPGNPDAQLSPENLNRARPFYRALRDATAGEVDYEEWLNALTDAEIRRLSIIQQAPNLTDRHLLMVGASQDDMSPLTVCHKPNAAALREAGARHFSEVVLDTDHMFLTKRYTLARLLITWLREEGGF
ncbi:alpha/beta hydrolase family protein [Sphingobium mellinum]|uniref:alpha/beta hydrolase family protein n=1 Tax=Sphingobium mellinum TaxID=1387166 RepID=UPI0030EE3700